MKQWLAMTVLVLAGTHVHAGPFTQWDLNGSSALLNTPVTDGKVRLTSNAVGQVGTAWTPGSLDWSSVAAGTSVTLSFSYQASGLAQGDGLALFVTSGAADQSPTGLFGLGQEDDGLAFFVRPAAGEAGSADQPNYPTGPSSFDMLTAAVPASVNLLSSAVFGELRVSFLAGGAVDFDLYLRSNPSGTWENVAYANVSALSASFVDQANIRIGFGASTSASAAHFDLLSFAGPAGLTPAVPEPESLGLLLAGLAVLAVLAARRRSSRQKAV